MAEMSAQQIAEKWSRNTKNGVTDYKNGVNNVNVNPAQLAIQNADIWRENVSSQKAQQRYTNGLSTVTLADWKKAAIDKGANRISQGVDNAMSKEINFAKYIVDTTYRIAEDVRNMPKATLDDRINRAVSQMRMMAENPYKG